MAVYICPQPGEWDKQHKMLLHACRESSIDPSGVPAPLILSGWWHSGDADKKARWIATLNWAERHGLAELILPLDAKTGFTGDGE